MVYAGSIPARPLPVRRNKKTERRFKIMVTKEAMESGYKKVIETFTTAQNAGIAFELAKTELDADISRAIFDGHITGKNEAERRAEIQKRFDPDLAKVQKLELTAKKSRLDYEIARINLDCLRDLLRIDELIERIDTHPPMITSSRDVSVKDAVKAASPK
jgi:hypothetical protein